jgi:hypothetical protein
MGGRDPAVVRLGSDVVGRSSFLLHAFWAGQENDST